MDDDRALRQTLATLRVTRVARAAAVEKLDIAIEAIKDLLAPDTSVTVTPGTGTVAVKSTANEPPTYVKAVEAVLKDALEPVHIDDMVGLFHAYGWYTHRNKKDRNFKNSIMSALDRGIKAGGGGFFKAAPATYGLLEWKTKEQLDIEG